MGRKRDRLGHSSLIGWGEGLFLDCEAIYSDHPISAPIRRSPPGWPSRRRAAEKGDELASFHFASKEW
jgi:hypothetical protein